VLSRWSVGAGTGEGSDLGRLLVVGHVGGDAFQEVGLARHQRGAVAEPVVL
jgi:hypothetical protein